MTAGKPRANRPILIVEDDSDLRDSLQLLLEAYGYAVATAFDGQDALDQLLDGLEPALIVLDLMMPRMDGWTLCRKMRKSPALAAIPVILCSAVADLERSLGEIGAV